MDLYNLITKIPYIIMIGIGLTVILNTYVGILNEVSTTVDGSTEEAYGSILLSERFKDLDQRRSMVDVSRFEETDDICEISDLESIDAERMLEDSYEIESRTIFLQGDTHPLECEYIDDWIILGESTRIIGIEDGNNHPMHFRVEVLEQ